MLGVAFDPVTIEEALARTEEMIASGQPHYVVTPNVDFLVQVQHDAELHRILLEAHLVLSDGTPLVWASRRLGNALPERVATETGGTWPRSAPATTAEATTPEPQERVSASTPLS